MENQNLLTQMLNSVKSYKTARWHVVAEGPIPSEQIAELKENPIVIRTQYGFSLRLVTKANEVKFYTISNYCAPYEGQIVNPEDVKLQVLNDGETQCLRCTVPTATENK